MICWLQYFKSYNYFDISLVVDNPLELVDNRQIVVGVFELLLLLLYSKRMYSNCWISIVESQLDKYDIDLILVLWLSNSTNM